LLPAKKSSQLTVMPQLPADMEIDSSTSPLTPTAAASPPPPSPPPRPPKSPNLAKDAAAAATGLSKQKITTSLKDRIKADYPKVVLTEGQSAAARVQVSAVPESPAVVALPCPPSRSVSLVESNAYQNTTMVQQEPPRPHSACSDHLPSSGGTESARAAAAAAAVISKSESTLNPFHLQTRFLTTQQPSSSNVYINISGGGSVQIDNSRSSGGGMASGAMACVSNATYGVGGGGVVVDNNPVHRVIHEVHHHHHHHFHPGPRLNHNQESNFSNSSSSTNNAATSGIGFFPARFAPTNPFLPDLMGGSNSDSNSAFGLRRNDASNFNNKDDVLQILKRNREGLRECGWYHGAISMDQANRLLQGTPAGTFLVRDSSSSDCMYALTFQQDTKKFPDRSANSVRIRFSGRKSRFQLDPSNNCQSSQLPEFSSVVELIEFYVKSRGSSPASSNVLLDEITGVHYPIFLKRPLRCDKGTVSLQHLARLSVHNAISTWSSRGGLPGGAAGKQLGYRQKNLHSLIKLDLPAQLTKELMEYPYTI